MLTPAKKVNPLINIPITTYLTGVIFIIVLAPAKKHTIYEFLSIEHIKLHGLPLVSGHIDPDTHETKCKQTQWLPPVVKINMAAMNQPIGLATYTKQIAKNKYKEKNIYRLSRRSV